MKDDPPRKAEYCNVQTTALGDLCNFHFAQRWYDFAHLGRLRPASDRRMPIRKKAIGDCPLRQSRSGFAVISGRRALAQPSMRSESVVVDDEGLHNVAQLPQVEAEEMIQTFALQAANPGIIKAVATGRGQYRSAVLPVGVLVEGLGEFAVPIMKQEADVDSLVLGSHVHIVGTSDSTSLVLAVSVTSIRARPSPPAVLRDGKLAANGC